MRHLLTDAQTSGGLLVSVSAEAAPDLLARIRAEGYPLATIIGRVEAGEPGITVR
jgi:selenide,water dikinase